MPRIPCVTVKENGGFECDGPSRCGSSTYGGLKAIEKCFHCSLCGDGPLGRNPKVVDNRGATSLLMFSK